MYLNKVILVGRLTEDPEIRSTPSGQSVCNFSLATNRVWTDRKSGEKREKTEFHNIVLWRKLAEIASQYLSKGSLVLIEGRLQTRSWQGSSGNRRYKTEVVGQRMQLAPRSAGKVVPSKTKKETKKETQESSEEDIPVIEEESPPEVKENSSKKKESSVSQKESKESKEEIKPEDLPF